MMIGLTGLDSLIHLLSPLLTWIVVNFCGMFKPTVQDVSVLHTDGPLKLTLAGIGEWK